MAKKKDKAKGKAYKRITFDTGNLMATLYHLWQRGNHPAANTDHSCECLDTLETFATENLDSDGNVIGMGFPKEGAEIVVSTPLHEYFPNFFNTLSPPGGMSRDFKKVKKAVSDAEKVFDKALFDDGWKLEDGVWFSPEATNRPKSEEEDEEEGDAAGSADSGGGEEEEPVCGDDAVTEEDDDEEGDETKDADDQGS